MIGRNGSKHVRHDVWWTRQRKYKEEKNNCLNGCEDIGRDTLATSEDDDEPVKMMAMMIIFNMIISSPKTATMGHTQQVYLINKVLKYMNG